jgi:phosphohistidine phosphatase
VKRLILLRHAKSSWDDPELPDHERPLSKRGQRDAPRIGERLRNRHSRPALIITSDAVRALATATIVAQIWKYPHDSLRVEPGIYLATPSTMLRIIGAQDDALPTLMIVGHNPGLTELANCLLPSFELDNLPTAGVLAIDFDTPHWAGVDSAPAELAYYDYPKNRDVQP